MEKFKNKKKLIGVVVAVLLICGVCGYFIYDNNRKQEIINKMSISFNEVKEIEYGTKDYDVKKELVKEVKDATLKEVPKIDTSKIGEQTLKFILSKDNLEKEVEYTIEIVDTKAPLIHLETESKELTVNDEYDFKSNIKEVTDEIDGSIELNNDALELNKKATEEYHKLEKDKITNETKVAEKSLNDFMIENIEDKEEKSLYLKNCYYIDGNVDVTTVGEYKINIVAVDKNGLKSEKEYKVTVKEKEIEQPQNNTSVGGGNYTSNGGGSSSSGGSSNGASVSVGSKQDIVNTALAQLGKPYQLGATGPNAFDCSGLIYYAYTQNGWSIPRYPESGGTKIAYSQIQPGDIIYMPVSGNGQPHVMMFVGNSQAIEAQDAGVVYFPLVFGVQPDWQFIRY